MTQCTKCGRVSGDDWKQCNKEDCPMVAVLGMGPLPNLHIITALPPEVEPYADDIRRFVDAMVYKLGVHASKGRWDSDTIEGRIPKLEDEIKELKEAVERGNLVEILLESADVANYALIIASIAVERGK